MSGVGLTWVGSIRDMYRNNITTGQLQREVKIEKQTVYT